MKEGARAVGTAAESSEDGAGSSGEQQQDDADEDDEKDEVDSSLEQEDEEEEEEQEQEGGGEAAAAVPVRRAFPAAVPVNDVSEGLTGMYVSAPLVSPTHLPHPISSSVSVSVSVSVPRRQCFCGTCPSTAAPPPCPPPWGPSGRSLRRPCWCPTRALHSPSSGTGAPWRSVSPLLGPGQACPSTGAAAGWIWLWTGQSVGATGKALPPCD